MITKGKFRHVHKITAAVGFAALSLIRLRIGAILLEIKVGEVMETLSLLY